MRNRVALFAVLVVALGGYTIGPAIAEFTKQSASKIFLKKKAAGKQYLKKKAANERFLKKQAASNQYEPASKATTVTVPPASWHEDDANAFMNVTRNAGQTLFTSPNIASDQRFFANAPLALSGPATVVSVEACFATGPDTSVQDISLLLRNPSEADPDPAMGFTSLSGANTGTNSSVCKTFESNLDVDPGDIIGLEFDADFVDTGSTLAVRGATITLQS